MNFFTIANKDSPRPFVEALLSVGHTPVKDWMGRADFMLYDVERRGWRADTIREFLKTRPGFIYPHTPYASYLLWDELYSPAPVTCNFVVGEGAKKALEIIGYPNRVEVVGFGPCDVKEFQSATGTRLLFAPPHVMGHGKFAHQGWMAEVVNAWNFILKHRYVFDSIMVRYSGEIDSYGIQYEKGIRYQQVDIYSRKARPAQSFVDCLQDFDLVISANTAAYISIASGKPTFFIGMDLPLATAFGEAKNQSKYMDWYRYPMDIKYMSIDEVLAACISESLVVKDWKRLNIGSSFDKQKFLSIVEAELQ